MVISMCLCFGLKKTSKEKKKLQQGIYLKRFLYLLEGEIRYGLSPLPDAIGRIANKVNDDIRPWLLALNASLTTYEKQRFSHIWEKKIKESLEPIIIESKLLQPIYTLGETLGYLDKEMQIKTIEQAMEQLNERIYDIKYDVRKNCKLYQTMSVCIGFLIVIILI